jgi:tetratricopeptide (TPR) repeat protein
MYVELGLVGVLLFSFFSFYFIKDWILINKNSNKKDSMLFNFLMIALVGSFINMMFSWPFQTVYGIVIFSIFTALIINKASNNKKVVSYKFNNFFRLSSILVILLILLFSFLSLNSWINNVSNFYFNSGTDGFKFKSSKLLEYAENIQNQDIHLSKVAENYWKAGYFDRASEVYSIATKYNKNNMLAQYRQFITALNQSLDNKAQSLLLVMQKNNKLHPLTFRASMNFYRAKGDIGMAKESYYFYKKYFNNLYNIDKRAAKTLHHWSIILGLYKDTPGLYETYIENFQKNVIVENNMANFYTYTQQYQKSVVHMTYVLKNKPDLIKPDVLKILQDKGFIKK